MIRTVQIATSFADINYILGNQEHFQIAQLERSFCKQFCKQFAKIFVSVNYKVESTLKSYYQKGYVAHYDNFQILITNQLVDQPRGLWLHQSISVLDDLDFVIQSLPVNHGISLPFPKFSSTDLSSLWYLNFPSSSLSVIPNQ